MKVLEYIKTLLDDLRARRRGERRIAPRSVRGRVYAKIDEAPAVLRVKREPVATLTMTITRKDGTTEKVTVPAQVTRHG